MRKALLALGVVLLVLLLAVVAIPLLFKDRLLAAVQNEISSSLNADVRFDDFDVTLLSSFPDLTLELSGLTVQNRAPFEGTTLAKVGQASVTVELMSALQGGPYTVRALRLEAPEITLITDVQGRSNTDLGGEEAAPATPATPEAEAAPLTLRLQRTEIVGGDLFYDDHQAGTFVEVKQIDHRGEGSVDGDVIAFSTKTDIGALSVEDGGVRLLREVKLGTTLDLQYNQATGGVVLGDNRITLNALPLKVSGSATPRGADWELDLAFAALPTTLKEVLSLVPSVYKKDMGAMRIAGALALQGSIKGLLKAEGDDLPALSLVATLNDGSFRDPSLPTGIDGIDLDLAVEHPGGDLDAMVVDLRTFALSIDGSPLKGRLRVTHPTTDPELDLEAKGDLDLGKLTQSFPIEGSTLGGKMSLDLLVKGRVSALEAGDLSQAQANGAVRASGLSYQETGDPVVYRFETLDAGFSPQTLDLRACDLRIGEADIAVTGALTNIYAYAMGTGPLGGAVSVRSKKLDLTPFAGEDEAPAQAKKGAPAESGVATVPTDLNLKVDIVAERVIYPPYDLDDLRGELSIADGRADLSGLSFGFLDGRVGLSGSYAAPTPDLADIEMNIDLADFGLGGLVDAVETLEKIAPIAKGASAKLNSTFTLKTRLGPDMTPDLSSLYSKGSLSALGLTLSPAFLEKAAGLLKDDRFKNLTLDKQGLGFEITDGRVQLSETAMLLGGVAAALAGSTGVLDQSLDLKIQTQVPLAKLKAAGLGSSLQLDKLGITDGPVDLTILIGGTFDKPRVELKTGLIADLKEQATALVEEKVGEVVDEALAQAKAAGDKLVAEAEKAAAALVSEAEKAGEKLKAEADKSADKLVKDAAGNPLKEAAAKEAGKKLREEAASGAKKLKKEAQKKGEALVSKAQTERDSLIQKAEAKAGR